MLPAIPVLRAQLLGVVSSKQRQGHVVDGLAEAIRSCPASYDALWAFAVRMRDLPLRPDWSWVEPDELEEILAECAPQRRQGPLSPVDPLAIAPRVETAFLASVCGCILGKPLEVSTDLAHIRAAAEAVGEWPLRDYIPERLLTALGMRHGDASYTTRETIRVAGADDDLNYSITGMLLLERHGKDFTTEDLARFWSHNLAAQWQWGPERQINLRYGQHSLVWSKEPLPWREWVAVCNPDDEACGAMIRVDAYGYACPGDPGRAAALAWRDAAYTHRRTGIYGAMFAAAAIAAAFTARDWREIFTIANHYVPRRSRFHDVVEQSIALVAGARDWLEGYALVHERFAEHGHCRIYQEVGTMINTLRFARDIGEGLGMQVAQGNDTDSYGCTCGSLLGAFHGPGGLEPRWLAPFNDTIHTTLAGFHEQRLSAVAKRMGALPALLVPPA